MLCGMICRNLPAASKVQTVRCSNIFAVLAALLAVAIAPAQGSPDAPGSKPKIPGANIRPTGDEDLDRYLKKIDVAKTYVTLSFPDEAPRLVFEANKLPTAIPKAVTQAVGRQIKVQVGSNQDSDKLYLINTQTGNAQSRALGVVRDQTWTVSNDAESEAYEVVIRVTAGGAPIDAAEVTLKDKYREQKKLIDPSAKGDVVFRFVRFGEFQVTVNYNSKGNPAAPVKQTFTIERVRDEPKPVFAIAVPEDSGTVGAASAKPSETSGSEPSKTESKEPVAGSNPLSNLLSTLLGLGVIGGLGYAGWRFMQNNPTKVTDTLEKLGADIPKTPDPAANVDPMPAAPKAPAPVEKIILGADATVDTPISSASAQDPSVSDFLMGLGSGPRLVDMSGTALDLVEGDKVVGRESNAEFPVVHDTVSRRHATLSVSGGAVTLTDLGSTNGTWVNGRKIDAPTVLNPGDSVRFGGVEYRFEG